MVDSNANIIMRCSRCQQNVSLSTMKYDKDGKTLICQQCRGLSMQEHLDKLKTKKSAEQAIVKTSERKTESLGGGTRYRCTSCHYAFTRTNIKPSRCPYCGKDSVVPDSSITGGKLLDEE
jgi:predicted Zn-ribbon and HTH transcriptional regulator